MLERLRVANTARAKEWSPGETNLSFKGVELAGEVGEACNIIKKMERERLGMRGGSVDLEGLTEELADVIICVDLIAMPLGIDLAAAIEAKFDKTSKKVGLRSMKDYYDERTISNIEG